MDTLSLKMGQLLQSAKPVTSVLPPRACSDFITSWMQLTAGMPAGDLFREWGAIFTLSAAMTRRTWVKTGATMPLLYPNLFALLTGDPGTGKDIVINKVRELLVEAGEPPDEHYYALHIGAKSLSPKGLVDALAHEKSGKWVEPQGTPRPTRFHSIVLCTPELGTLLPQYNPHTISIICDLYNCSANFDDQVRSGKGEPIVIERPHLAFIFGTQPSFLGSTFPEEAYKMGFFSRVNIVFEPNPMVVPMFFEEDEAAAKQRLAIWHKLVTDTRIITRLHGQFTVMPAVRESLNQFHLKESKTTHLSHTRFQDYNTRRHLHLTKLAMIYAASRSSDMIITSDDLHRARMLLLRTEERMPQVFQNITSNRGFHNSVEEVMLSLPNTGTFSEATLIRTLRRTHPPHEVYNIIQSMIASGEIAVIPTTDHSRLFRKVIEGKK